MVWSEIFVEHHYRLCVRLAYVNVSLPRCGGQNTAPDENPSEASTTVYARIVAPKLMGILLPLPPSSSALGLQVHTTPFGFM